MPAQRLPWFKFWHHAPSHPKIALLSDAIFRTWVLTVNAGSQQPERGQFASLKHAALASGRPVTHIKALVAAGLLDVDDSGVVTVHDFTSWNDKYPSDVNRASRAERPAKTPRTLRQDSAEHSAKTPHKFGEKEREKKKETERETETETTLSPGLETTPAPVPPGGETPGPRAANAAPPGLGARVESSEGDGLEPLRQAFDGRGLDWPPVMTKFDREAGLRLLDAYGPELVASCWQDVAVNGHVFERKRLSFDFLAKDNRVGNWKREQVATADVAAEYDADEYGDILPFRRAQ